MEKIPAVTGTLTHITHSPYFSALSHGGMNHTGILWAEEL